MNIYLKIVGVRWVWELIATLLAGYIFVGVAEGSGVSMIWSVGDQETHIL